MEKPAFLAKIGRVKRISGLSPLGGTASSSSLSFTMQIQTESNWCWAAVSTSVSRYFNSLSTWSQCTVADSAWARTDCCGGGSSGPCNQPWYLDRALTIVNCFDRMTGTPEHFPVVQSEISAQRPLCSRIGWYVGGGHFTAIAGWQITADGTEYYEIHDPIWGVQIVSRIKYETAYRSSGRWTHSYFVTSAAAASGAGVALAGLPLYSDAIGA